MAKEIGMSVQTVHDYEKWGFLPSVKRGPQGYRLYTYQHLHALRVTRSLIQGYGWRYAQRIMQFIHQEDFASAWAEIDARHAEIHRSRCEVEETLHILREMPIGNVPDTFEETHLKQRRQFLISEAAQQAGVRVSAVRFWEEQGLLHPIRSKESRYRLYDEEQLRNLRVVALLRKTGTNFATVQLILAQLTQGAPEQAIESAEKRLQELAKTSQQCVKATSDLWKYIEEHLTMRIE